MVADRLQYSVCWFTCSTLLLLGIFLQDVEASSCQHVIHKKVGDSVELPSCLPTEGVTLASWRYGQLGIADKDVDIAEQQFTDRLHLNLTTFSLTVRGLTLQDSGDYSFVSEVYDKQRETVNIKLQVHEPITTKPVLNGSSTWHTSNESCTVWLECSATSDSSYNWTVRNQTISGPRLQYILKLQDGDTKFTCTAYNIVSQMSESKTEKCSNNTREIIIAGPSSSSIVPLIVGPVIGILLIILLLLSLLIYTKSKDPCFNRITQSETINQDETQQQVYSSLLHGDGSVYETLRPSADTGTGGESDLYSNVISPSVHL